MNITIANNPMPLAVDNDSVFPIGRTRVSLDSVVFAFKEGATA